MRRLLPCFASLAALGLLVCATGARAGAGCSKVKGAGQTFGTGPATFQGTATLALGGQVSSAAVTTNLLGPPQAGDDGALHATTSHTFVFADGSSLTTLDRAVLSPTETPGLYALNTNAVIAEGTGAYTNACGRLRIHGTINLFNPEASWQVKGRVCFCG